MAKFAHARTMTKLIRDEQDAQKAYGAAAKAFPQSASTLKHIGREEREHEKELQSERKKRLNAR